MYMISKIKIINISIISLLLLSSYSISANYIKNNNEDEIFDLLIIAPKEFVIDLQPLVHHKESVGIKTKLESTEKVYEEMFWYGRDDAEKIKYFIKIAIEEWNIKYVLLVGGRKNQGYEESWWVPVRYSNLQRKYGDFPENKFLCDLYFADIYDKNGNFSSWDNDNDGLYSEWYENHEAEDIPDLYPDIYLGRLPCRNNRDVKIIVNKIIKYETSEFSDSWFKTMVVVAGDTYTEKTEYIDGEVYTQRALDNMPGFNPIKLYTSDDTLKNPWDTVKAINKGCGFIYFSGHGNPSSWSTHPPNDESTWIDGMKIRYMPFLINKRKLPVCITGSGCFNSMFNVSLLNHFFSFYPIPKCWSEGLTFHPYGGSIATIGATAFSYESPDVDSIRGGIEWLDIHFFEEYGIKKIDILGEIWSNTISSFLDEFPVNWSDMSPTGDAIIIKNAEPWLLIGDPSLKIGGYN